LPDDQALVNRLGFNNEGATVVAARLRTLKRDCIIGVNIGKNRDVPNEEAIENYLASFDLVHDVADYIAINISSPNTPNLRELQQEKNLEQLIGALVARNTILSTGFSRPADGYERPKDATQSGKPILVKIAPDLDEGSIEEIIDVCVRLGVDGIIATNTTVSRDGLKTASPDSFGAGGLSGRPLAHRSNEIIRSVYRYSKGALPIIGVGGIFSPEDAFEKIAAGASLLQAYTGFIYKGPSFASEINSGLQKLLDVKGFETLDEAIGCEG
jgi:dihydroorotate dehydrogenase